MIAAKDRHSAHYCAKFQQYEIISQQQWAYASTDIETNLQNIQAAWNWTVERGHLAQIDQAINTLTLLLRIMGRRRDAETFCEIATQKLAALRKKPATAKEATRIQAKILACHSLICQERKALPLAQSLAQQSLAYLEQPILAHFDVRDEKASTLRCLAQIATYSSQFEEADALYEQSQALYQALDNQVEIAHILLERGQTARFGGRYQTAEQWYEASLTCFEALDMPRPRIMVLQYLGILAEEVNDYEKATQYFQDTLNLAEAQNDHSMRAWALRYLGTLAFNRGQFATHNNLMKESISDFQAARQHSEVIAALTLRLKGFCFMGEFVQAKAILKESLTASQIIGYPKGVNITALSQAFIYLHLGNYEMARQQAAEATSLPVIFDPGWVKAIQDTFLGQLFLVEGSLETAMTTLKRSVGAFERRTSRDDAIALAIIGRIACDLTQDEPVQSYFYQALQIAREKQAFIPLLYTIPMMAHWLATQAKANDLTQKERAVELYALASSQPLVAKSRWFADVVGQYIDQVATTLPSDIVAAARKRGQALDWWETAEHLLQDLENIQEANVHTLAHNRPVPSRPMEGRDTRQRYIQEALIATGGMGEVYQGRDTETGQRVAIKRLKAELVAQSPEWVARLLREGEALRRLNHPNIVQILAMIEDKAHPLIVMEYVPGGSLRDLLEQTPQLPLKRVLDLSLELADALTRAHHLNILHRDIKPANILLAEDGSPRLTDFGVAYLNDQHTHLTQAGSILDTIAYLSPEACTGNVLDTRSDIWSFGAVLFEMLAGRPLFDKPHITAILAAILGDPIPDLATLRPNIPVTLIALVKEMLAKDQTQRIDSMRQIAAELDAVRRDITY